MLLIEENGSNIMFSGTEDPKGNNSFTSSTEYLVPLEGADDDTELEGLDFADKTTPRNRTFSSSPGDSSKGRNSFDEYFSAPESMEKYADDNDNDYDSSDDDVCLQANIAGASNRRIRLPVIYEPESAANAAIWKGYCADSAHSTNKI